MNEWEELKKEAVERIYLIPDRDEGRLRYVWCDDPAPGYGMCEEEAVEYVRRDKYDALAAHVERLTRAPATNEILEEIHRRAGKEWGGDFTVTISRDEYEAFEAEQEDLLSATPTTSLARLIAEKQAGALEESAAELFDSGARNEVLRIAGQYLRQAEEPNQ